MSFYRVLRDLTHLGVTPDIPPSEAKYIILTNSVSLLGLLVSLLYFPVNLSVGGSRLVQLVPPVVSTVGFSLPLWLNHRRRLWAATTAMSVAGLSVPLAFTLAFGSDLGNHFYFLPILSGVTLLYPPQYRKTAGLFVLIGLISFIAIVLWGDNVSPLVPFHDEVARNYYALALIISAALVAFISYYAHRRTVIVEAQVAARSRELVRTIRELQATQAQMVEAENQAVLARLVAGLLHEINTPLGSIRSAAGTMAGAVTRWEKVVTQYADPSHPDGQAALRALEVAPQLRDSLDEGTERISTVVEGLRQFVGLDEAERKPLDVRTGIDGALALLGPSIQGRIEVIRDYAETPLRVLCRPAKLNRAFLSVLQNAVQAIEGRGVLCVSVRALDGRIEIDVIDDGKGIPASKMPEIFELGLTRKSGRVGLRLGLPMSKRCIEELGGQLAVESVEGKGTTVRMTLPLAGA